MSLLFFRAVYRAYNEKEMIIMLGIIYLLGAAMVGKQHGELYDKVKSKKKLRFRDRLAIVGNLMWISILWPFIIMYNVIARYVFNRKI